MNICFFSDAQAEHTRRWVKYFALKGHNVDLITFNPNIIENYSPVRIHVVRKPLDSSDLYSRIRNLPYVYCRVRNIIKDIAPDVIHAHSAGAYAWLTMIIGFRPYVITPWGSDILIDAAKSRWNRYITFRALHHADLITCDGYNIKDKMVSWGVRDDKIKLVTFGVDTSRFLPKLANDLDIRGRYGIGDSKIVISTRTLTSVHNVETFVRAIPLIRNSIEDVCFVIVGDGSERIQLENLAYSLGVEKHTRFIGRIEEDDMARLLRIADVYVSTSLSDSGIAASTAEAMACQLPVVVTDNGDNREWINEGNGGYIVPIRKPETVAKHVVSLLSDKEMSMRFGCINREIIEDRNNYAREMERMELLYDELSSH